MRLDSANRSFLAFMGLAVSLASYLLCGAGGVLASLLVARMSRAGLSGPGEGVALLAPFAFTAPIAVGFALAGRSLARQALASRRLARRVRGLGGALPDQLKRLAAETGLAGRVVLVDAPASFSFVFGAANPRVAVSRGLLEGVSGGELRAVLEHESYHVRNLDPLKVVLVRALSAGLFFLPALDPLGARYVAARELAADRRAVALCGRRPLIGAMLKVVRGPEWSELAVAAPIGGPELLSARVAQLETGALPRLPAVDFTRATLSLLGTALLTAAFLASAASFGGSAALDRVNSAGLAGTALFGGLSCAALFAGAALFAFLVIALRASRPV